MVSDSTTPSSSFLTVWRSPLQLFWVAVVQDDQVQFMNPPKSFCIASPDKGEKRGEPSFVNVFINEF